MVTLFKAGDVYYLEYQPDNDVPDIGLGVLSARSLAVTFASKVATVLRDALVCDGAN